MKRFFKCIQMKCTYFPFFGHKKTVRCHFGDKNKLSCFCFKVLFSHYWQITHVFFIKNSFKEFITPTQNISIIKRSETFVD